MSASTHLARAWKLYELSRYSACIATVQQHLAEEPDDAEAFRLMAHAAAEAGDAETALTAARQAIALAPFDASVYLALAVANHVAGNRDAADSAIDEARGLNPEDPRIFEQFARQTIVRRRWQELVSVARDGLELDPRSDYLLYAQALASSETNSPDLAARQIEEGLSINPENANLLTLKGALLVQAGDVKEGTPHLLDALRVTPTSKYAHAQLKYARLVGWFTVTPPWLRELGCFLAMLVALYLISVAALILLWLWGILTGAK